MKTPAEWAIVTTLVGDILVAGFTIKVSSDYGRHHSGPLFKLDDVISRLHGSAAEIHFEDKVEGQEVRTGGFFSLAFGQDTKVIDGLRTRSPAADRLASRAMLIAELLRRTDNEEAVVIASAPPTGEKPSLDQRGALEPEEERQIAVTISLPGMLTTRPTGGGIIVGMILGAAGAIAAVLVDRLII